ncbi:MAG: hypothetical protein IPL22_06120 [Bacteroidetes bacterium]|nr:hypothetical protein [Bacteroidota bacterium]
MAAVLMLAPHVKKYHADQTDYILSSINFDYPVRPFNITDSVVGEVPFI